MASEKEQIARKNDNPASGPAAEQSNPPNNIDGPGSPSTDGRTPSTGEPPKSGSSERNSGPVVYDKPVFGRDRRAATPLAATALARFDPSERRPQLSEHFVYRDRDLAKRGYF